MFGIANQLLAVLALCLITTLLINTGRGRYAPVTLMPMLFVTSTTMSAGVLMVRSVRRKSRGQAVHGHPEHEPDRVRDGVGRRSSCCGLLSRWILVMRGVIAVRPESDTSLKR